MRDDAEKGAKDLNTELMDIRHVASEAQTRMDSHTQIAEVAAVEAASMLAARHCKMEELLQQS